MIAKPKAADFDESPAIGVARETAAIAAEIAQPAKLALRPGALLLAGYGVPVVILPAVIVLEGRWPGFFPTVQGHYAVLATVALGGWLWKGRPYFRERSTALRKRADDLEDTASMRAALLREECRS